MKQTHIFIMILLIILILLILYTIFTNNNPREYFYQPKNNIICLITRIPNKTWCDFLNGFTKYKIYIILDDNDFDLTEFENTYNHIKFIKVENEKCKINGYTDMNEFIMNKSITGWEKALYYFTIENTDYDFIWFIEDDVFFYNEDTIVEIDKQYPDEDLLTNEVENEYIDGKQEYIESVLDEKLNRKQHPWHWDRINILIPPPYYACMACAIRCTPNMLKHVNDYAKEYKQLFFLEALFSTIAIRNNLKYKTPTEFNTIKYQASYIKEHIDNIHIYHPVKHMIDHDEFRE